MSLIFVRRPIGTTEIFSVHRRFAALHTLLSLYVWSWGYCAHGLFFILLRRKSGFRRNWCFRQLENRYVKNAWVHCWCAQAFLRSYVMKEGKIAIKTVLSCSGWHQQPTRFHHRQGGILTVRSSDCRRQKPAPAINSSVWQQGKSRLRSSPMRSKDTHSNLLQPSSAAVSAAVIPTGVQHFHAASVLTMTIS